MGASVAVGLSTMTENGPQGVTMWSPSLVTLKSCLGSGGYEAW